MSDRFYLDPNVSSIDGQRARLCGDEAHHFSKVMRGKIGAEIFIFDGIGTQHRCVVDSIERGCIGAYVVETLQDQVESRLRLTIATALPKGDRQKVLAEKLAELGVDTLIPIRLDRSVAKADSAVIARLKRQVIEAAKQCGRNVLMNVAEEMTLNELCERTAESTNYLLHPLSLGAVGQASPHHILRESLPDKITVLVGPEGSFTEEEVRYALAHHFKPLELGARILRTETACIAAAAMLLTYAG